ncbi:MAG: hypothetical protein ABSC19_07835 [Syntrophorhabdales bacterium]|jgi:hypothetical protein
MMMRFERLWRILERIHTIVWLSGLLGALGIGTLVYATIDQVKHSYAMSTILTIDVVALALIVAGISFYRIRSKSGVRAIGMTRTESSSPATQLPFVVTEVYADNSDSDKITYKSKVRIVLRNQAERPISLRRGYWIADGRVPLQLPARLKFRIKIDKDNWSGEVPGNIYVGPQQEFSTWIGLFERLSNEGFRRVKETQEFGTLALEIDGTDSRQELRI